MPRTDWGWQITPDEIERWVLPNPTGCDDVLAIDKPAHVVCHPTKHGPWSSLSSAVREHFKHDPVHLISRLDRETSGVILIGKTQESAARLRQRTNQQKIYLSVLHGILHQAITVERPLAKSETGVFRNQQCVVEEGGQRAVTIFEPLASSGGFTLVRAIPVTGRMHQIRVHAAFLGHPVAGDKLYPDEALHLAFLRDGWTPELAARLPLQRQALHAYSVEIDGQQWNAPLHFDMEHFLQSIGLSTINLSAALSIS